MFVSATIPRYLLVFSMTILGFEQNAGAKTETNVILQKCESKFISFDLFIL